MTNKAKEAIEHIEDEVYSIEGLEIQKITFYTKGIEDIKVILNLIKNQEAEIEKYKQLYDKALDDVVRIDEESHLIQSRLDVANAKVIELNNIINEMLAVIYKITHEKENGCSFQNKENCSKYNSCTQCIYEYFENIAKGE